MFPSLGCLKSLHPVIRPSFVIYTFFPFQSICLVATYVFVCVCFIYLVTVRAFVCVCVFGGGRVAAGYSAQDAARGRAALRGTLPRDALRLRLWPPPPAPLRCRRCRRYQFRGRERRRRGAGARHVPSVLGPPSCQLDCRVQVKHYAMFFGIRIMVLMCALPDRPMKRCPPLHPNSRDVSFKPA